jgi:hypothetical protein
MSSPPVSKGQTGYFLTDVYAASEEPIPGISGKSMAEAVRARGQEVEYLECLEDVGEAVAKNSRPGDVILFLGAGDITQEAHKYAMLLNGTGTCNERTENGNQKNGGMSWKRDSLRRQFSSGITP